MSNAENACWVCDTPLDESKPIKPYGKEEEGEAQTIIKEKKE